MIFKVAILQKRSINRAYNNNTKSVIGYMSEAKKTVQIFCFCPNVT